MAKQDVLTIRRSQPVQGQQVDALVDWNGQFVGELRLPFGGWLKFKRLLEKGIEMDARENYGLGVRVTFTGLPQVEPPIDAPQPAKPAERRPPAYQGSISGIAAADVADDVDEADLRAVEAAEARSLRRQD
jgi:hypothetical protein